VAPKGSACTRMLPLTTHMTAGNNGEFLAMLRGAHLVPNSPG